MGTYIGLYDFLLLVFTSKDGKPADLVQLQSSSGLTDEEWDSLSQYTTQVLSNLVNYKSFGFTKIIPRLSEDKFEQAVKSSANTEQATALWSKASVVFSLEHCDVDYL